jgi:hypothetical protein
MRRYAFTMQGRKGVLGCSFVFVHLLRPNIPDTPADGDRLLLHGLLGTIMR